MGSYSEAEQVILLILGACVANENSDEALVEVEDYARSYFADELSRETHDCQE